MKLYWSRNAITERPPGLRNRGHIVAFVKLPEPERTEEQAALKEYNLCDMSYSAIRGHRGGYRGFKLVGLFDVKTATCRECVTRHQVIFS